MSTDTSKHKLIYRGGLSKYVGQEVIFLHESKSIPGDWMIEFKDGGQMLVHPSEVEEVPIENSM